MRRLTVRIIIGRYEFKHAISVTIDSTWQRLADTAEIQLPAFGRFSGNPGAWQEVQIKSGDAVQVHIGYDGQLLKEFEGYVVDYDYRIPYKVRCEGESYRMKRLPAITKSWKSITLKALIAEITSGIDIEISSNIPDVTLSPFAIKSATPAEALQKLADEYIFAAYFRGKKLFVGLPYTESMPAVQYSLNGIDGNVNDDSGLSYQTEEQKRIKVKAVSLQSDGSKLEVNDVGDSDGEIRTLTFRNIASTSALRKMAEQQLSLLKYEGYNGSLVAYGVPYASHGYTAQLKDGFFPERAGRYVVDSVETYFGVNGFRRTLAIGKRL
jgi:phage protein D